MLNHLHHRLLNQHLATRIVATVVACFCLTYFCFISTAALAQTAPSNTIELDLEGAIARAMIHDHRIGEKQALVGVSEGLVAEAEGALGVQVEGVLALAVTTDVDGGFFTDGTVAGNNQNVRDDLYDPDGFGPWFNLQFRVVQPLYTFGKGYYYKQAAESKVLVDQQEVNVQRGKSALDVAKAYFGYLTARSGRLALESTIDQLESASKLAEELSQQSGSSIKPSDLFVLSAGLGQARKFRAEAAGLEQVALAGLRALTGVPTDTELTIADRRLRPLPLPEATLEALQQQALSGRPEMAQVEAGLKARRALVEAKMAEQYPNLFAGVIGTAAYSPNRETLDNPYIIDPFNNYAATPVIGLQWDWKPSRQAAQRAQEEAELAALVEKKAFAMQGIPFEVAEAYYQMKAAHEGLNHLEGATRDARRALNARYLDFEAGIEEPERVLDSLRSYTLTYGDYLLTVNAYNMHIMKLRQVTGTLTADPVRTGSIAHNNSQPPPELNLPK